MGADLSMEDTPLDDSAEPSGRWGKLKEKLSFGPDDDEEEIEERPARRRGTPLRLHSLRVNRVSVWHAAESFETARQVADGLKEGHPQVVNLENTSPEMAERIIDFLNGVTYALDGYVEKVGNKVYFFTPSNMVIDVEESTHRQRSLFAGN